MKKRLGFVSNSSSSSFVCDICKEVDELSDYDEDNEQFMSCIKGHNFCVHHLDNDVSDKIVDEIIKGNCNRWEIDEEYCPVCNLADVTEYTMLEYLLTKYNVNREDVIKEIKTKFKSGYPEFIKYIS